MHTNFILACKVPIRKTQFSSKLPAVVSHSLLQAATFTRLVFKTCKVLMQTIVISSMNRIPKNTFLVYGGSGGVACQMPCARRLICMVDFKDEDADCIYVIKPIRHFLTSAAHMLAPRLCFDQHHSRLAACLNSPRGKKGLKSNKPGREAFRRQCRSNTDFLWSWRMPVAAELPLRPEEVSEGEGSGQSVLY